MSTLFGLLFLASFISLFAGLVYPNLFKKLFRGKDLNRKFILKVFGTATAVLFLAIGFSGGTDNKKSEQEPVAQQQVIAPVEEEAVATKEIEPVPVVSDELKSVVATSAEKVVELPQKAEIVAIEEKTTEPVPVIDRVVATKTSEFLFYSVSRVIDGDTVEIDMGGKKETLRLIGMDTPETVDPRKPVQCFGVEASNQAKLLLTGKKVRIENDPTQGERDKYNRLLAYVYREDGLFYNKQMIEQGYAHEYTYNIPYKYQAEFKAAQKSAQENKKGLWSPDTCNGDTAQTTVQDTDKTSVTTNEKSSSSQSVGKFYTSSASNSTTYYPESCLAWQSLSPKNLRSFSSLEDLLKVYPQKTLNKQCQ